jgi:uncharacterized membrane protein YfcA
LAGVARLSEYLLPEGVPALVAAGLVFASFFTSALTSVFGVGGGVAMLGLMGLVMPVASLIPVHGVVQLGSNTGRAIHQRSSIRWPVLLPFFAGATAGTIAGGAVVVELPDALLKLVLGAFIVTVTWSRIPGFDKLSRAGLVFGGAVMGVLTMFLGATGPLAAAFMSQIIPDNRKALIATDAVLMASLHLLKAAVFGALGFAFADWLPMLASMIATGYAGTVLGARFLERLPEETFRFWFRIVLTALALDMMRRGIMGLW